MTTKQKWLLFGFPLAFLFVWEQLQSVRLGYQMEALRAQVRSQEAKNAYLRLEVERLHAPQRLAQAAQERLGMLPPHPEALIVLQGPAAEPLRGQAASLLSRLFSGPRDYR